MWKCTDRQNSQQTNFNQIRSQWGQKLSWSSENHIGKRSSKIYISKQTKISDIIPKSTDTIS